MHQTKPLIGITCYGRTKDPDKYTLPVAYIDAILRGGGRAVIIPPGDPEIWTFSERFDGFVLSGGGDIDPSHYLEDPHPELSDVDPDRDALELNLAKASIDRCKPLLAICRGMQVLNVALGGTLIQHLPDEVGLRVPHLNGSSGGVPHRIDAEAASQIARVCGGSTFSVLSKHHQSARRLGEGLRAVAWSEDGIVEAIEAANCPNILGVQWHPEETASHDSRQQALFDWLIEQARLRPASRREPAAASPGRQMK